MVDTKQVTVRSLAVLTKKDPGELLQTMHDAGITDIVSVDDCVSAQQKMQLLRFLKQKSKSSASVSAQTTTETKTSRVGGVSVQVKTTRKTKNFLEAADPDLPVAKKTSADKKISEPTEKKAVAGSKEKPKSKSSTVSAKPPTDEELKLAAKKILEADARPSKDDTDKKRKGTVRKQRSKQNTRRQVEEALSNMESGDDDLYGSSGSQSRRPKNRGRGAHSGRSTMIEQSFSKPDQPMVREVSIPETLSVAELAAKMTVKGAEVIKVMMKMGVMATINQSIDQETASIVVEEMGHVPKLVSQTALEEALIAELESELQDQQPRPPVVTIMGHVDHGKTSLLDSIRRAHVTSSEAGGITQHIGAYHVQTEKGTICFLDTPGHAAFAAMRARGAKCTDIVVLVVAADDGVMPQTIEAIQHANAAEVPLVVAINKIDKPDADLERIRSELSQHGVISEEWGGENMFQEISAKTGENIDKLLDTILLQAEVLELKASMSGPAKGVVIESRLDKGRGPVATVLVSSGTLHLGDIILAGREYGRVRAMIGDDGSKREEAGPAVPVEILGLSATPVAGDETWVVPDERRAREVASDRQRRFRQAHIKRQQSANLENIFANIGKQKESILHIILKADVQGSAEAISDALNKLSTDEVKIKLVSVGVGGLNESDIHLAIASNAVVLGFNVRANAPARALVEKEAVDLRYYSIIYNLIDEVKAALSGMLSPEIQEKIVGMAEVREVFRSSKLGSVAGCMVIEGAVKRHLPIRVLRDNIVIYEGELESLRRYKEDAGEVTSGKECGIGVKNYNDVKVGDVIEAYQTIEVKREL